MLSRKENARDDTAFSRSGRKIGDKSATKMGGRTNRPCYWTSAFVHKKKQEATQMEWVTSQSHNRKGGGLRKDKTNPKTSKKQKKMGGLTT